MKHAAVTIMRKKGKSLLTLLAGLVLLNLLANSHALNSAVLAQSPSGSLNWQFFPIGNQAVRKLVIWDPSSKSVYEYSESGKLENTWVVSAPGEPIQKR